MELLLTELVKSLSYEITPGFIVALLLICLVLIIFILTRKKFTVKAIRDLFLELMSPQKFSTFMLRLLERAFFIFVLVIFFALVALFVTQWPTYEELTLPDESQTPVHNDPDADSPIVAQLPPAISVVVIQFQMCWANVQYGEIVGWIQIPEPSCADPISINPTPGALGAIIETPTATAPTVDGSKASVDAPEQATAEVEALPTQSPVPTVGSKLETATVESSSWPSPSPSPSPSPVPTVVSTATNTPVETAAPSPTLTPVPTETEVPASILADVEILPQKSETRVNEEMAVTIITLNQFGQLFSQEDLAVTVIGGTVNKLNVKTDSSGRAVLIFTAGSEPQSASITVSSGTVQKTAVFIILPPPLAVTAVSHSELPISGGTELIIYGISIDSGAIAYLNGISCQSTDWRSSEELRCHVPPAQDPGPINLQLHNPDGESFTLSNASEYIYNSATLDLPVGDIYVGLDLVPPTTYTAESFCQDVWEQNGNDSLREVHRIVNGDWETHVCGSGNENNFLMMAWFPYYVISDKASSTEIEGTLYPETYTLSFTVGVNPIALPSGVDDAAALCQWLTNQSIEVMTVDIIESGQPTSHYCGINEINNFEISDFIGINVTTSNSGLVQSP